MVEAISASGLLGLLGERSDLFGAPGVRLGDADLLRRRTSPALPAATPCRNPVRLTKFFLLQFQPLTEMRSPYSYLVCPFQERGQLVDLGEPCLDQGVVIRLGPLPRHGLLRGPHLSYHLGLVGHVRWVSHRSPTIPAIAITACSRAATRSSWPLTHRIPSWFCQNTTPDRSPPRGVLMASTSAAVAGAPRRIQAS